MSTQTAAGIRILPAPIPESLDAPDAWALRGANAVERAVTLDTWGHPDLAESLLADWAWARTRSYGRRLRFVVVDDGVASPTAEASTPEVTTLEGEPPECDPATVVGRLDVTLPTEDNTHLAEAIVMVTPSHRRRGLGSLLAAKAEEVVRADGRRVLLSWSDHAVEPPEPGLDGPPVLRPPTGSGRIPDDAASRFAVGLGFGLEQAERHSVLDLPADGALLDDLEARARAGAGADYRVVTWADSAPDEWVDGYAVLQSRMSTDVPLAALEIEEETWDAARIRDHEETRREAGQRLLVAAAEHVPTGALAAFTVLVVRPGDGGDPDAAFQDSTLVLREHRGHRLGMLVKLANVRAVQAAFPSAQRIHTWNAEENEHMLAINVAMGFRPAGISAIWQKHLA